MIISRSTEILWHGIKWHEIRFGIRNEYSNAPTLNQKAIDINVVKLQPLQIQAYSSFQQHLKAFR
jgi:hypothetical protein